MLSWIMFFRLVSILALSSSPLAAHAVDHDARVPDLAGREIVYSPSHPFLPEVFRKDGRWHATIAMFGPAGASGFWKRHGRRVCVTVEHSTWRAAPVGSTICRDMVMRNGRLTFRPIGERVALEVEVVPTKR